MPTGGASKLFRILACLMLCASEARATGSAPDPAPASCPPAPVRVVRSRGGTTDYVGTVPGIPDLCRIVLSGGPGNFYLGIWRTDWPGAGDAYPAAKQVLTGPSGTRVSIVTRSVPSFQFMDSFINEGVESLTVDGHTYRTVKVSHERQGFDGNTYHSVITAWRDIGTGINLTVVEHQISGQSYGPDATWDAVRVIALPPPK